MEKNYHLERFELVEKEDNQVFGTYSHMGGKIVTLAVLEGTDEEVAKRCCYANSGYETTIFR